ncbi:organic hydroperoxide resistance protein [Streptomyces sp. NPDC018610]|uniref:organic hydroperoxide resistance protein n=1 Tax=Streptomyces sp. NPDC018610 TaxID=3365049 RepID=UPI0037A4B290
MDALYTAVATAGSAGREGRAATTDGRLDVVLAPPAELGGSGQGTNPEQLFAAGYAACFASAVSLVGRQNKVDTSDISITAEVSLGKDETSFALAVVLRAELPEELDNAAGRALVEHAHQLCPYSKATRGNIPVELVVE